MVEETKVKEEVTKVEEKVETPKVEAKPVEKTEAKPTEAKKETKPEHKPTHREPKEKSFEARINVDSTKQETTEKPVFVKKQSPFSEYKLFDKWTFQNVIVSDLSLVNYINLDPVLVPHSFGKKSQTKFGKANINIVERLINKAMRSGQGKRKLSGKFIRGRNGCGKKFQTMEIVENAFTIVETKTKKNPIQVLVDAIENAAPREDVTRIKRGGVAYSVAVDVSPMKRLDEAIKNIALAGFGHSFNNRMDAASALAEEIVAAAGNDTKSMAIKRKDEVERIAKSSR
ncbi:MAG: 30S ribosomal protein S7 [Candidatus Diapherotrites archaeon]|jgi:small subunit ribosomal protein S7|nr:30S ribosomal protein S7 [Candidatus Diapherotrites archaeon]MBT4596514.1 30S ribosomal protein S7 [Candidatus Diapherotrites archaeon]